MPLPFAPYPKVSDAPSAWRLTVAERRLIDRSEWIVTEKIHGAHFALLSDGWRLACAKRKAVLDDGDAFFAHERLAIRHGEPVRALARQLRAEQPELVSVTVHGELFGGGYPHPKVTPVRGVQPVQTGVWYSPDIAFEAFDIAVTDVEGRRRFLDLDDAIARADAAGVPFTAIRFRGSLTAALAEPCRFRTTVPQRFGLPPLADNLAEGVVIKPTEPLMVHTRKGLARPMVKRKIAEFVEDARYHAAQKWRPEPSATSAVPPLDLLELRASELLESNRFAAARSKQGPVAPGDRAGRGLLSTLIVEDVLDALGVMLPDALRALDEDDRALLRAVVRDGAEALVAVELQRIDALRGGGR